MIVTYAPLVSDARGRFGGQVLSAWRGTRVSRRFTAPSNPNTADQVEVRRIFINSGRFWLANNTRTRAAWEAYAAGKNFTGRNRFIAMQVPALQGAANLNDLVGTPGDASTLGPTAIVVTPGAGQLSCAITEPALPTGWTITEIAGFAVPDTDWGSAGVNVVQKEAFDAATPFVVLITGLTAGTLYQVRCWIKWLAPDATARYSVSVKATSTPT